jgi:uncharacterized protein (TIGR00255 family)
MVRSMTGFGEASAVVDGAHYFVEIRSLNNKYFKSTIRLGEVFQGLEAEFESKLRERLSRGTVTMTARMADATDNAAYEINTAALQRYIDQLNKLPQVKSGEVKLDVAQLLELPGVLQPPSDEEARYEKARAAFFPVLDKAIDNLLAMRAREGQTIVADLLSQRDDILDRLKIVRERAPGVIADYEQRLKNRIEELLRQNNATVDAGDLIREIGVFAERTDIAEEIKRLSAHIDQFTELLTKSGGKPIGRTLDFLAQEMLREANTIGSKSPDAAIARSTVEIKGAIDRIKEQVQNIE